MAIIIPISTKTIENPVLTKLKAMDKKRAEKVIAAYELEQQNKSESDKK
jgi:hypothetical protein